MDVAGQYNWTVTTRMILVVVAEIAVIFVWSRAKVKLPKFFRLISLVLSVAAVLFINSYLIKVYPAKLGSWGNGHMFEFSYALKNSSPKKPSGYSASEAGKIAENYKGEIKADDLPDNVICIMVEAWSDLTSLGDYELTEDPFEFYNSLTENTVKGKIYSSVFGGNTANSEYEFLTGNTVANLPENIIAYQYYLKDNFPSLVTMFSDLGYETVSYHPQTSQNYNRANVYSWLDFDESYWEESFDDNEYVRELMSDSKDFRNVERIYENKTSDKLFVFNVSSQNHGGYGGYKDFERTVHVKGHEDEFPFADEYFTLTDMTDDAIKQLIEYFSNVDEKTVICMFGDHQPLLEPEFYNFTGCGSNAYAKEKYFTDFLIWANYDIEEKEIDGISINYLSNLLFDLIGLEPAGYGAFIRDLQEEYPVISAVSVYDKNGNECSYDELVNSDGIIRDYSILQYNYVHDQDNRIEGFFWD